VVVNGKMRVLIDSSDLAMRGKIIGVLEPKGIHLVRFRSVRQACEALTRKGTLLVFREIGALMERMRTW